jgi:phthiocerol/phenolphthiocerol synthesis type-I polyketide synthase C
LLASGTIDTAEPGITTEERHDHKITQTHCLEPILGPSFYQLLAEHGLQYRPAFHPVAEVWRRDGEATARLTPLAASSCTVDIGDLDVALLDACFQVMTAALPAHNGQSHDTYRPVGVSEVRVHRLPVSGDVWCHALLRTGLNPDTSSRSGFHPAMKMCCEPQSRETMSREMESS